MDKYSGKKLDSRYMINELIGSGGMALVYRAYDTIDDREVAIKILKDEFLNDTDFLRRFKNESKAIAVLSHPNIVKVYDVSFGDRIQYIVMEYINGITLKDYIKSQHEVNWKEAIHFITQVLRALQHAHEKGIIHRDIKPQNIMLLQDGTVKVTDFGIARFAKNETRTMTDKVIGSVHYIAPEQARGDITDAKADIYSVGVMLYELLAGKVPFDADNAVSVAIMQLQTDPVSPRKINPNIPKGLEEITLKSMQKNPDERYQSAAEMLTDIESFKRNPNIRFEYKPHDNVTPSKYIDAIDDIKNEQVKTTDKNKDFPKKKKKPTAAKYAIIGVSIAAVLVTLVFGIMALTHSCASKDEEVEIPNFVGMQYSEVMKAKDFGTYKFNFIKEEYTDATKPDGEVLDQNPKVSNDKKVKASSDIKLTVNVTGVQGVSVPDIKSLKEADAVAKIKSLGLIASVTAIVDSDTAVGVVKYTDPAANTTVSKGSTVNIYVSKGASSKKVSVPKVINETLESAKKKIEEAGLKVGTVTETESNQSKGIVLETDPLPTSQVESGSAVNITVSSGKHTPTSVEVHIKLPTEIYESVVFNAYTDGQLSVSKVLVPAYTSYYTINVTGTSGTSTVIAEIDGQKYWTYYVNFDNAGKITDEKNPNFIVSSSPASSTVSNTSSLNSSSGSSSISSSSSTVLH